jgi:glycosyltransferase involved in cell wall biosynthesis
MNIKFSIVVVSYKRYNELKCLLYSLLSQTYGDFELIVLHDGPDEDHKLLMDDFKKDQRIIYIQTPARYNDWGMTLRNIGIEMCSGDFIINTNDDNYYTPNWLMELNEAIQNNSDCNFIYYDSVDKNFQWQNEKQSPYSLFKPKLRNCHIDMGQFAARKDLIAGRKFNISYTADGEFVESLIPFIHPVYIEKVLFVHN